VAVFAQDDWGGGIFRGRRAPPGTVYDAVNALVDDEGQVFKRTGSAYKSDDASNGDPFDMLADVYVAAGRRTLFSGETAGHLWALGNDDHTPQLLGGGVRKFSRPVAMNGFVFFPGATGEAAGTVRFYAGSLAGVGYSAGTVTVTNGSTTVTGAGTAWLANADAGMILGSGTTTAAVKSVDSNTQITLLSPWPGSTAAGAGYALNIQLAINFPAGIDTYAIETKDIYLASVGQRLLYAGRQRVYESTPGDPFTFDANSYQEIPSDAYIIGADSLSDTGLIFTTSGIWAIENLALDIVDDAGNVQQQVQNVTKDVILWDNAGIAAWEGALVVPAIDDVYIVGLDGPAGIVSQSIRPLYRSYVSAGYQPGLATVHRGHLFLPIVNGSTWVDTLVCRLDLERRPWTRWAGHAAGTAYVVRVGATTRSPKLFALGGTRVLDLTASMSPTGATQDANSTTPTFRVDENDIDTGPGIRPDTTEKVRYVYETTGGTPTISVSFATGPEGSSYSAATPKRGGGASTGTDYSAWKVSKKAERIRFRFESQSQVNSLILRRREATIRQQAQN
jgi:hypothetical protein